MNDQSAISPVWIQNYNDETILAIRTDNQRDILLHSAYDKELLASLWTQKYDLSHFNSVAVVCGIADGIYIKKLRELYANVPIMVYEPVEELWEAVENSISEEIKNDSLIYIYHGNEGKKSIFQTLISLITYDNKDYIRFYISPNYELIDRVATELLYDMVHDIIESKYVDRYTWRKFGKSININIARNIIDFVDQATIDCLYKNLRNVETSRIPAVIIAAGPSLDKNIELIKEMKGRAFLIAVDSSLKALDKKNIVPDIVVTVDPEKPLELFMCEMINRIPMVVSLTSNHKIKNLHHGRRFYFHAMESYVDRFYEKYGIPLIFLESGGSVANDAYSLALQMGFETIIFVGQDLAYPNERRHVSDSYTEANEITANRKFFEVEDIYGNLVKTEFNMNVYRKWYEKMIVKYAMVRHIDATEGGAKIHGTEIMTLRDAIDECCPEYPVYDFEKLIDEAEYAFDTSKKAYIWEDLASLGEKLSNVRHELRNGIALYEKLIEYNAKKKYSGKGFEALIKRITGFNTWITNSVDVQYLSNYTFEEDYIIKDEMNKINENETEDFTMIAKNGIRTTEALLKAVNKFEEDMSDVIIEAQEKLREM